MKEYQDVFKRYEKKYLLDGGTFRELFTRLQEYMKPDRYGNTTVCNIYYDTPDHRLIRTSLEKPVYKEKLRLRSYGVPQKDAAVFVELKKKYKGVVYKRRIGMPLQEAERFLNCGESAGRKTQIEKEIGWVLGYYPRLTPALPPPCSFPTTGLQPSARKTQIFASPSTAASFGARMRSTSPQAPGGGSSCNPASALWKSKSRAACPCG